MTTKTDIRPVRLGFCNPSNPPASHGRCPAGTSAYADGVWRPCSCTCHTAAAPTPAPVREPVLWDGDQA